ncbi:hypothetical protein BV20DRAFT_943411 [Pilatotrama ljubarskyi]|nr:hypothetical protein BV20DRAFT_943411 [Pilatotrama ljubarskyi]
MTSLMMLNEDCLEQIFKLLRPDRGLRPLSLTSKWMRSRCIGVLFERSFAYAHLINKPNRLPPPSIWPYIRSLTLRGFFDNPAISGLQYPIIPVGSRDEDVLSNALKAMPQLSRILLNDTQGYGLPWPILAVMLSMPQVREFDLRGRLFHSRDRPPPSSSLHAAPLVSFRYTPYDLRPSPRTCSSERRVLAIVLEKLCSSLESLAMPSESAPFRLLNRWDWPRLRELSIEGHASRVLKSQAPLISVLSTMRHLRVLTLKLAYSLQQDFRAIWPQNEDRVALPWPDLESLTISWAYPDDRIFDHLPPSLRHLSLRSWPRLHSCYARRLESHRNGVSWKGRNLKSSDVLCVLKKCQTPTVDRLEVEYKVDAHDLELLRFIPVGFPNLRVLQIHRNRVLRDFSPIPVVRLSRSTPASPSEQHGVQEEMTDVVSSLPRLRVLRLYLDLRHLVQNALGGQPYAPPHEYEPVIDATVAAVTRKASPSLKYLCLLVSFGPSARWAVLRLERDADGHTQAFEDETLDAVEGYE